jgi:hypothetical protein
MRWVATLALLGVACSSEVRISGGYGYYDDGPTRSPYSQADAVSDAGADG